MKWLKGIPSFAVSMMISFSAFAIPSLALAEKAVVFDPNQHRWYA